ncbi:outer membrane protein assembly factor BamE [Uliginosibacterium sp. 31-16]|uniref:outer membrane protein assembly factor BamE n=1 Tax=Uliginosibacterium sp. 31-16 TaxID=3068315 RepID=UPI00273EF0AC|nr:outer membrane protein assembly factor BamE [Uliginosibacterium sp. 31-16]MDP5240761.1 outer membrane protein assembly factor BamE [Uliginosibacterium sp. 31-16]
MVLRTVFLSAAVCLLTACSSNTLTNLVKPYRIDVRQGNAITQEMLSQLSPGMSREQVRFVMGSPLLVDVFHADRWDYVYQHSVGYAEPERRKVALFFANDKLLRVEGDVVAGAGEVPIAPRVIDITGPAATPASAKP